MSPNDEKAVKLCARMMGVDPEGYNPIKNNDQADALREKLGLTIVRPNVNKFPSQRPSGGDYWYDVLKDGEVVGRFSNFSRNLAIVWGACNAVYPGWDEPKK